MKKNRINGYKTLEIVLSIVAFIVISVLLAMHGSGPIFSDELLYTDIGLNNTQVPSYGNRYFHVYVQKLFMALAPTPLTGVKIYWGFIVALTALLVYWNARSFFKHSNPLHGLLAVGFFFSYKFISEYCGVTSADITAMTMVTILLTLYLFYLRYGRKSKWVPYVMGLVVFLAFKTKETTVFGDVILLGLAFDDEGKFSLKNILPLVKLFLLGVLTGIGFFIVLDTIFLHSPFFAVSPSTFAAVVNNYAYAGYFKQEPSSYYTTFLLAELMVPFLLYLLSGMKNYSGENTISKKMVWLFPLILTVFMTLNMLKIIWGFIERFYFPALPVIAILAPQFIDYELPKSIQDKIKHVALLLAGIGLVLVLREVFSTYADNRAWDYGHFLETIFVPVVLSLLLGIILIVKKYNWWSSIIPEVMIVSLLIAPLLYNEKYIFRISFTGDVFNKEYYPFITYKDQITYNKGMNMYMSFNIPTKLEMLSTDRNEISAMFNIYFNGRTDLNNFKEGMTQADISNEITEQKYDYVLLTVEDWAMASANPGSQQGIEQLYRVVSDPNNQVVLLKNRND